MNMSFYSAAVGAIQQQQRMNVQSNNIANVNTHGFRAERASFGALMNRDVIGIDNAELPKGTGTRMTKATVDFNPSGFIETGRTFDFAINGDGFFAVVDLASNEVSLTRNGAFVISELQRASGEVDDEGVPLMETVYYLSDNQGRFVLSRNGGMIEVDDQHAEQPVGVFDYINYSGMEHIDGTRFLAVDKNGGIRLSDSQVVQGVVEQSNADLAEELTKVIETQRAYGMALKMVQTSDEIESTINGLSS